VNPPSPRRGTHSSAACPWKPPSRGRPWPWGCRGTNAAAAPPPCGTLRADKWMCEGGGHVGLRQGPMDATSIATCNQQAEQKRRSAPPQAKPPRPWTPTRGVGGPGVASSAAPRRRGCEPRRRLASRGTLCTRLGDRKGRGHAHCAGRLGMREGAQQERGSTRATGALNNDGHVQQHECPGRSLSPVGAFARARPTSKAGTGSHVCQEGHHRAGGGPCHARPDRGNVHPLLRGSDPRRAHLERLSRRAQAMASHRQ
jgi:hypothetical protein